MTSRPKGTPHRNPHPDVGFLRAVTRAPAGLNFQAAAMLARGLPLVGLDAALFCSSCEPSEPSETAAPAAASESIQHPGRT